MGLEIEASIKVTAAKVLAEFANLDQYESAKAAAADAGLTPSHDEAGTSVRRRPRMLKLGKAGIRAALYWPAIAAIVLSHRMVDASGYMPWQNDEPLLTGYGFSPRSNCCIHPAT